MKNRILRMSSIGMMVGTLVAGSTVFAPAYQAGASGVGANAKSMHSYKLAETTGGSSDAFYVSLNCGASQEAKALGSTMKTFALPTGGGNAQDEAMDQAALLYHPAGVLFGYEGSENYVPIIKGFQSKGIPVVEINSATTASNYYQAFVAPQTDPNVAAMAKLIAKNAGDSGTVIVLAAAAASPVINARWMPIVAALKKMEPQLKILATQYDGFSTEKAESIASGLLIANPNVKAIWTTSGPEGEGAIAAVKADHRAGKALVYSYDAEPLEVAALKSGTVKALLAQSPYAEGKEGVESLVSYLNAHGTAKPVTSVASPHAKQVPTMILTKANVNSTAAKPYLYKSTCS